MKNILILGAGQSAPYLISYLLNEAEKHEWFVTVCDRNYELACERVGNHPRGTAMEFDVNDEALRHAQIKNADVVVNFLAPPFQFLIAQDCLHYGKHVITASYQNIRIPDLHKDAQRKGIIILNEMGLDPGIDNMSAARMINNIHDQGGIVKSFISYGSALPEPNINANPLNYCITWNARNVVMAGESGAQYMEDGKIKILPHYELFQRTWDVDVDGVGRLEAYPNRDSLAYLDIFKLEHVDTMIRGTLRYPGWSETWRNIIKLGLPNEIMVIPDLPNRSYAELTEMFLPLSASGNKQDARVANLLGINPTGRIMENLKWLGLFSDEKIGGNAKTATDAMVQLLYKKMPLPEGARDMVALVHEIIAEYPDNGNKREKITSTFVEYGDPGGFTSIAKTVGVPAAIAAKAIMQGNLPLTGCQLPTHPIIYNTILDELKLMGMDFKESIEEL